LSTSGKKHIYKATAKILWHYFATDKDGLMSRQLAEGILGYQFEILLEKNNIKIPSPFNFGYLNDFPNQWNKKTFSEWMKKVLHQRIELLIIVSILFLAYILIIISAQS